MTNEEKATKLSIEDIENLKKLMRCISDIRTIRISKGKKTRFDNYALEKVIEEFDLVLDDIASSGDIADYISYGYKMTLTLEGRVKEEE
jgi:hypothetical protein